MTGRSDLLPMIIPTCGFDLVVILVYANNITACSSILCDCPNHRLYFPRQRDRFLPALVDHRDMPHLTERLSEFFTVKMQVNAFLLHHFIYAVVTGQPLVPRF